MTFAINEPLTAGTLDYPYAIITVEIIPSRTLGATELIVADIATADTSQLSGRQTAGVVTIELIGVNPSSINQGTIAFALAGSWLMQHSLTPDDIVLMQNSGGQWSELPTAFVHQNVDTYYFKATTMRFSNFAITTSVNATTGNATAAKAVTLTGSGAASSSPVSGASVPTTVPVTTRRTAMPASEAGPISSTPALPAQSLTPLSIPVGIECSLLAVIIGVVYLRRK
jgi:PGF-pre-PGF domain-containing protein